MHRWCFARRNCVSLRREHFLANRPERWRSKWWIDAAEILFVRTWAPFVCSFVWHPARSLSSMIFCTRFCQPFTTLRIGWQRWIKVTFHVRARDRAKCRDEFSFDSFYLRHLNCLHHDFIYYIADSSFYYVAASVRWQARGEMKSILDRWAPENGVAACSVQCDPVLHKWKSWASPVNFDEYLLPVEIWNYLWWNAVNIPREYSPIMTAASEQLKGEARNKEIPRNIFRCRALSESGLAFFDARFRKSPNECSSMSISVGPLSEYLREYWMHVCKCRIQGEKKKNAVRPSIQFPSHRAMFSRV